MARRSAHAGAIMREKILYSAAILFLEKGYTATRISDIADAVGATTGAVVNHFHTKEDILCNLVGFVIEQQFSAAGKLAEAAGAGENAPADPLLLYAAETVLQLHIVEMNENLRDLYCTAYSLSKPSAMLQQSVTSKVEQIFGRYLPGAETKDFFKLEIASGGIMRGFMTIPCDMWFTLEQKVEAFLETTLIIYRVPEDKIREAVEFVRSIDFAAIAKRTVDGILNYLSQKEQDIDEELENELEEA